MKIVKMTTIIASSIITLLFISTLFIKNTEETLYKQTIEVLMMHEKLSSHEEVVESFPQLKIIKSKIAKISSLKGNIDYMTGGPNPNTTAKARLKIQDYNHKICELQGEVRAELFQLLAMYEKK